MMIANCASLLVWAWILGVSAARPPAEEHAGDLRSRVPAVRKHAAVSLGRSGERAAVPALVEALKDPEKDVRREAAKALGSIKDARAVTPLVEALGDSDGNVRLYAAYALGEIKDPKAVKALLAALGDPEWCVRDQAAWALREIGDPTLAAALKARNADVAHIAWLLRHVGGTQTVRQLAALLEAPEASVRMRAVHVLSELQNAEAVPPLIAALEDRDPNVRQSAVEALQRIGDDRAKRPMTRRRKRSSRCRVKRTSWPTGRLTTAARASPRTRPATAMTARSEAARPWKGKSGTP